MKTPRHILEWASLLKSERQLVVEASRDHGKSWMFSYAWPLFLVQRVRQMKDSVNIALISYSEEQSRKNLARIRKSVETKETLKWLMPTLKSFVWDAGKLEFSNGSTIESFGFGSSIRGGHYHLVVIDDPTKDHWTMSLAEQENFFYGVIIPAVRRGGQIVVTGNPVEKQDLLERLENNREYKTFKYPVLNDDGVPLWPEQYTVDDINARRRQIPAHIFAREYLLKRVSAADATFKEEWIKYYRPEDINNRVLYKIMTVDPAISPGGDALGVSITGTDSDQNVYILDRLRFRGDLKTGIGLLCDMMSKHQPDFIGIETFAFQRMYKVWLEEELVRRNLSFHVQEIGQSNRKSKDARISAIQPKLAQGKLFFIEDEHKPLIDQLLLWDRTSKNNEDDEIDALAWQVPLWRAPYEDAPENRGRLPGTFDDEFEQLRMRSDVSYLSRLFSDFRA